MYTLPFFGCWFWYHLKNNWINHYKDISLLCAFLACEKSYMFIVAFDFYCFIFHLAILWKRHTVLWQSHEDGLCQRNKHNWKRVERNKHQWKRVEPNTYRQLPWCHCTFGQCQSALHRLGTGLSWSTSPTLPDVFYGKWTSLAEVWSWRPDPPLQS